MCALGRCKGVRSLLSRGRQRRNSTVGRIDDQGSSPDRFSPLPPELVIRAVDVDVRSSAVVTIGIAGFSGILILRGRLLIAEHVLIDTVGPFQRCARAIRPYSLQVWIAPCR